MPLLASSSISPKSACGSTTTPLPMTQVTPACRMPRRNQPEHELRAVDVHGVAGVVPALIAGDDIEARRQEIDDLALAFVAPLRAKHGQIHIVVSQSVVGSQSVDSASVAGLHRQSQLTPTSGLRFYPTRDRAEPTPDCRLPTLMILLTGSSLTLEQLTAIADRGEPVGVAPEAAVARVAAARAVVDRKALGREPVYGINTGFGSFADVAIAPDALETLQRNLLRSHAAGLGAAAAGAGGARRDGAARERAGEGLFRRAARDARRAGGDAQRARPSRSCRRADRSARAAISRRSRTSRWCSSAKEKLSTMAPARASDTPRVDGDPRSRLASRRPGAEALRRAGLSPITLGAQGRARADQRHAAVHGRARAGAGRRRTAGARRRYRRRARRSTRCADRSVRSRRGSTTARGFAGQTASAANIERLIAGSGINRSHELCGRVQDAYSMRCAAQVHGATREALALRARHGEVEANAATDNPMVFADTGEIVSGGNFHGAPMAIAADLLAAALAPLATISERRTDRLVNPALSGLPAFLTREGGLRSGLMLAQVTAAAVASELKTLAHPAGVDTIPTSASKEDHVSMSMAAALKAERALDAAREVVADRGPLRVSGDRSPRAAHDVAGARARRIARCATRVPTLDDDRPPAPDIASIAN